MKKETFPEIEDLCKDFCESPFQEIEMASGDQSISLRRRSLPKVAQFQPKDEPKEEQVAKISPSEEDQSLVVGVHRVGLFFPSVKSGDRISKGQVIGHIKAMNIQHELKSGLSGIVGEVLVEAGSGVAYGDPVVRLRGGK